MIRDQELAGLIKSNVYQEHDDSSDDVYEVDPRFHVNTRMSDIKKKKEQSIA